MAHRKTSCCVGYPITMINRMTWLQVCVVWTTLYLNSLLKKFDVIGMMENWIFQSLPKESGRMMEG